MRAGLDMLAAMPSYAEYRKDYTLATLLEKDLAKDPFKQFEKWFQEAVGAKLNEPNAVVLSTCTREGRPSSRTVLMKSVDARGFVFYTNYDSRKGREMTENRFVSLLFPWIAMERQILVEGTVTKLAREESEAYFHSRPRPSQLAAWASTQDALLSGRAQLDEAMKTIEKKYAGAEIPMPPNWGGFRLSAESVEFWQGRRSRLHDRLRYRRQGETWVIERLSP